VYMENEGNQELLEYQIRLNQTQSAPQIWEKKCLTLEEAAAYSGVGIERIRRLLMQKECPFRISQSNKLMIMREKFDEYMDKATSI
jgi:hypothetical protein